MKSSGQLHILLLFTLFSHDCQPAYTTDTIIKFESDTTVLGLINNNDEQIVYRSEIKKPTAWSSNNNRILNK